MKQLVMASFLLLATLACGQDTDTPHRSLLGRAVRSPEVWLHAGHAAAATADLMTSHQLLDRCPGCTEGERILFGSRPTTGRYLAVGVPVSVGLGVLVHYAYKRDKGAGIFINGIIMTLHGVAASSNAHR